MIVIIGGGVMGCTLAYTLAKRGAAVTLLERGRIGQTEGASSVPVALLNPYRGRSARASDFDRSALEAMWALVSEVERQGLETGVVQSGVLRVASNAKQAKQWQKRDGVSWFGADEVPTGFYAPFGGFVAPSGGWLRSQLWLAALTQAAREAGARVLEHYDVTQIVRTDDGLEVLTRQGFLDAHTVVLCSGSGMELGQKVVGLEHVAGEVIGLALPEPEPALPYPLAGAVYGAQVEETFYLGGNHRPADQTDESAPTQLQRAGGWFVPALKSASLKSVWHGVRVKADDNLPVVKELQPGLWFAGGLAGRGFLASAYVAETLCDRLLTSR